MEKQMKKKIELKRKLCLYADFPRDVEELKLSHCYKEILLCIHTMVTCAETSSPFSRNPATRRLQLNQCHCLGQCRIYCLVLTCK